MDDFALWSAFAERVTLSFPFRVDVVVSEADADRTSTQSGARLAQMAVVLHVLDRDTREPITVRTRRPVGEWKSDEEAVDVLFELLGIALTHETHESVRLDGKLVREVHNGG